MSYLMELLTKHARDNVWCTPTQDTQYMIKPSRVTPTRGAKGKFTLVRQSYPLPSETDTFHVYQFGQVPPAFFNLIEGKNKWRKVSAICNQNNVLIDLYLENGIQFPRFESYFLILPDKNIILAVKQLNVIPFSLRDHSLNVRFYSNAFFSSARSNLPHPLIDNPSTTLDIDYHISVTGKIIQTSEDIATVAQSFATQYAKPGHAYGIINGYRTNTVTALTVQIGDVVEIVHDSTIAWVVDIPVSELTSFTSTLDSKTKYLVTFLLGLYATEKGVIANQRLVRQDVIWYKDDIDMMLYTQYSSGIRKGVMYHRNRPDSLRMITHKDYSIPTQYVDAYIGTTGLFGNLSEMRLQLQLRLSGYERPLIDDVNSIRELYKLADLSRDGDEVEDQPDWHAVVENLNQVMLGVESGVPNWRAEVLEASKYVELMRSYRPDLTEAQAVQAYGHNTIEKIFFPANVRLSINPPQDWNQRYNGIRAEFPSVPVTWAAHTLRLYANDRFVEHHWRGILTSRTPGFNNAVKPLTMGVTGTGLALGNWIEHPGSSIPSMRPILAEVLQGNRGNTYFYLNVKVPVRFANFNSGFRCLKCPTGPTGPTYEWVDITETNEYTAVPVTVNGNKGFEVTFNINQNQWYTAVFPGAYINPNAFIINTSAESVTQFGLNTFTVTHQYSIYNETTSTWDLVTMAAIHEPERFELYGNGFRLIENLDYTVKWPEIRMHSALPLQNELSIFPGSAHPNLTLGLGTVFFNYTMMGLGTGPGLTRVKDQEYGFIKSGIISANGKFDIRDTKNYNLYIGGWKVDPDAMREMTILQFAEDGSAAWVLAPELSGLPYEFDFSVCSMDGLPSGITQRQLKEADVLRDERIGNYLSGKFHLPEQEIPHYAAEPYKLYSPFFMKILIDLINFRIPAEVYANRLTDGQVQDLLSEDLHILEYDPCRKQNAWYKDNVVILGHAFYNRVPVTAQMWVLLTQINRIYLYNKIDIAGCLMIQ